MKTRFTWSLLALLFVAAGCDSGQGPDSLFAPQAATPSAGCVACHNSTSTIAPDPLVTNGSGTYGKHISHVQSGGIPCERCHYNYAQAATHMTGTIDTGNPAILIVYFDSTNPSGAWINDTGPGTGTCSSVSCHGGYSLDWYGTGVSGCAACHFAQMGSRRPVLGANGDFGANPAKLSHHITGTADPTPAQCQACHDMSQHMGGTVRLKQADTGAVIAFDPAVPSTLEPFCLSCHDTDGAGSAFISAGTPTAPFNDGSTLGAAPYTYALRIKTSWTSTNGHGPNGNHATIKKLTCLGSGQPGTGCHGSNGSVNAHGSIDNVIAAKGFKYDTSDPFNDADFDLCFNCHSNYIGFTKEDTLGVKFGGILDSAYGILTGPNGMNPPYYIIGLKTLFADHNVPDLPPDFLPYSGSPYNDYRIWGPPDKNLHWFHLGGPTDLRGTGAGAGIVCVNCHDVHGSSNPYGATYDEIGYSHVVPDATNRIGIMTDNAYNTNQLEAYPTYCAFNCHYVQGPTRAWYYPIVE